MSDPSIRDVARAAGVSTATVSRVLNDSPKVRPRMRARVLEAMELLHYEPSGIARNMRSQNNKSIGLITAGIQNSYFSSIIRAATESAYALRYTVLLSNSNGEAERERIYLELLARERAAGAIVFPAATTASAYTLRRPLPIVFCGQQVNGVAVDAVILDHVHGGYIAARHLLDAGHERIGLVAAFPGFPGLEERKHGYCKALREAGIDVDADLIQWGNAERTQGGYQATKELLAQHPRPTAIMAVNNMRTIGLLQAVREAGLRVPEDISLVGFDDSPWLPLLDPPLTTVRQPLQEIGEEAVRLLAQRIETGNGEAPVVTVLQPELVVRASVHGLVR